MKQEVIKLIGSALAVFSGIATVIAFLKPDMYGLLFCTGITILYILIYIFLQHRLKDKWEKSGKRLFANLSKPDYLKWQQEILEMLYDGLEFTNLYNRRYPAAIIRPCAGFEYPYNNLCKLLDVHLSEVQISKKQKKYLKMLGKSLKWPDMKGFALKRIQLDNEGHVKLIEAITTNFRQNVITTHILEWELFEMFQSKCQLDNNNNNLLKNLPLRSIYHNKRPGYIALLEPMSAYPLISLQAMVVFRDYRNMSEPLWKIVIAKRSDEVVIKPGFLQFQPAGGFEVYGSEIDDDDFLVRKGFDIKTALLREYAEELFNATDLQYRPDSREAESAVLSDQNVQKLTKLINSNKAYIDFLGIAIDLAVLRHELSFLIIINDESFCQNKLLASWEAKNFHSIAPSELQNFISEGNLHSSSAALLQLAIENKRLKEFGVANELMMK